MSESTTHSSIEEFVLDQTKASHCIAFVQGFLDGWALRVEAPLTRLPITPEERAKMLGEVSSLLESPFCMSPQGLSAARAVDAFAGYCKLKPPDDADSARIFLMLALAEAFPPCPAHR